MSNIRDLKSLPQQRYALLIGEQGSGKTTLATRLSKLSCTNGQPSMPASQQKDQYYSVNQNKYSFVLIDGSGCEDIESIGKLTQTSSLLDHIRISAVFFVIKYDNRFERLPESYFMMEDIVKEYADRIFILISHYDHSKSPEKDRGDIREVFEEECPNVKNIKCYSEETIDVKLAKFMYDCIITDRPNSSSINVKESPASSEQSIDNPPIDNVSSINRRSLVDEKSHESTSSVVITKLPAQQEKRPASNHHKRKMPSVCSRRQSEKPKKPKKKSLKRFCCACGSTDD